MKPINFVKVMNELGLEDFNEVENLYNMIELDLEVTQKNLLRALTAIAWIQTDSLIFDPLKEYLDDNENKVRYTHEKIFAYGKIVNGVLYFNSESSALLFSNAFKAKFN